MGAASFGPGDVIADKYRVERVLGEGGMGLVLAATHLELRRKVALKFMLPGTLARPGAADRFAREARAAAALTSEYSVRIHDFGRLQDGAAYIVMEYLEGLDLAALLDREGPLGVQDAVRYVLQACVGLSEAHARSIVHRDIKPQNLFLARSASGEAIVKVLDFGVSKLPLSEASFTETKSGTVLGSPGYMAPEQMRAAHEVDARADIWALGCVLYRLLTGASPFDAATLPELCAQVLHADPRPIASLRDLPPALARLVTQCLEKDPAARPAHLGVLAAGLAPFAGPDGPVLLAKVMGALGDASTRESQAVGPDVVERASVTRGEDLALAETHAASTMLKASSPPVRRGLWFFLLLVGAGTVWFAVETSSSHPAQTGTAPSIGTPHERTTRAAQPSPTEASMSQATPLDAGSAERSGTPASREAPPSVSTTAEPASASERTGRPDATRRPPRVSAAPVAAQPGGPAPAEPTHALDSSQLKAPPAAEPELRDPRLLRH